MNINRLLASNKFVKIPLSGAEGAIHGSIPFADGTAIAKIAGTGSWSSVSDYSGSGSFGSSAYRLYDDQTLTIGPCALGRTAVQGAVEAIKKALYRAGKEPCDMEVLILAKGSISLDGTPAIYEIQRRLEANNAFCIDLTAGETSFLTGLELGRQLIVSGAYDTAVVVAVQTGEEATSQCSDGVTCRAGAVVLDRSKDESGIIATAVGQKGELPSFKADFTGQALEETVTNLLFRTGLSVEDLRTVLTTDFGKLILLNSRVVRIPNALLFNRARPTATPEQTLLPNIADEAYLSGTVRKGDYVLAADFDERGRVTTTLLQW